MANFAGIRNGFVVAVLASAALLSGCGGEGTVQTGAAAPGSANSTTGSSSSQALSLTGTPVTSVKIGDNFSFTPTTAGAGTLGFTIANKPTWATFSTATGALTGKPSVAHVGTYANIVISATSSTGASGALAAFSLSVTQTGATTGTGSATLSWTPPTQNTDGSSVANLAGYRIYYGNTAGSLTNSINLTNPSLTAYTVANLGTGTTYFGITAYTSGGVESGISNIGSKTIM